MALSFAIREELRLGRQMQALRYHVFEHEGQSVCWHAARLGLRPDTASTAMRRLWERGDVKRKRGGGPRGGDTWYKGMGTTRGRTWL